MNRKIRYLSQMHSWSLVRLARFKPGFSTRLPTLGLDVPCLGWIHTGGPWRHSSVELGETVRIREPCVLSVDLGRQA